MFLTLFQYTIISYLILLPAILNIFLWENQLIAWLFGGIFLFFQSLLWGQSLLKKSDTATQILFGLLTILFTLLVTSTSIYLLWNLSAPAISLTYLFLPVFGVLLLHFYGKKLQSSLELPFILPPFTKKHLAQFCLLGFYGMLSLWMYSLAFSSATAHAITTVWDVLPSSFWLLYFLATLISLTLLWHIKSKWIKFFLVAHHLFMSSSLVLFIYQIGYGFDPFIHQAAELAISKDGVVLPKTPYYIGQYGLVTVLHTFFVLPVVWVERFLLPFFFSLGLPLIFLLTPSKQTSDSTELSRNIWIALIYLLIPFTAFLVTTPQALANTFFIYLVLLLALQYLHRQSFLPFWYHFLVAVSALLVHPIAGIASLILVAIAGYQEIKKQYQLSRILEWMIRLPFIILASITVPLLFIINSYLSTEFTTRLKPISAITIDTIIQWFPIRLFLSDMNYRSFFFEFGYFIQENIWWILTVCLLLMTYWLSLRSKTLFLRVFGSTSLLLLMNAVLVSSVLDFPELIQYETYDYAGRLFQLAFWAISPVLILGALWLKRKLDTTFWTQWLALFTLASLLTGSMFISYPRNNRYELGRQYSVSEADLTTVKKIRENKSAYVVLANQSVSAAAIKLDGFKRYYTSDDGKSIFYYPVPTSGPLYQYYLSMVYEAPTKDQAKKAAELTGVHTVYFVLNRYWDNAPSIAEQAKLEADEWFEIADGEVLLFRYDFKS